MKLGRNVRAAREGRDDQLKSEPIGEDNGYKTAPDARDGLTRDHDASVGQPACTTQCDTARLALCLPPGVASAVPQPSMRFVATMGMIGKRFDDRAIAGLHASGAGGRDPRELAF